MGRYPHAVHSRHSAGRRLARTRPHIGARAALPHAARRLAALGALVGAASLSLLALPATAIAAGPPQVNEVRPGSSLGIVNGILIFGVIPIGVFGVLALIFLRPGSAPGAQRYRPGRGWNADPTWIGVPGRETTETPALEGAEHLQADAYAVTHADGPEESADVIAGTGVGANRDQGGARGSW